MGGIHQRPGLASLDGFDGLGYQPVVSLSTGLVFAREAHAQTEHLSPPSRVTPCSHLMCCTGTRSNTYSLYDARIQSTLSVSRDRDPASPARTHAHSSIQSAPAAPPSSRPTRRFTAALACLAAALPSGPRLTQVIAPGSRSRTMAAPGPQLRATRPGTTDSTSSAPSLPTGTSKATTPPAPSGQDSTGPTIRDETGAAF